MAKIIVFFIVLFLCIPTAILAQGIGVPIGPPPIGTPLPIAPRDYAPVWSAPWPPTAVPPAPTPLPTSEYTITVQVNVTVYTCPSLKCYNIGRLLPGTTVLVRPAGPGWVQIQSGYLTGEYVRLADL